MHACRENEIHMEFMIEIYMGKGKFKTVLR
jgi:hypothetical protein